MSANWIGITLANLNSYLESALVVKLNTADLAANQLDRFTDCMTDTVNEIRTRIQSMPGFVVSETDLTVPPELKRHACQLTLLAMSYTCPGVVIEKGLREEWAKCRDVFKEIKDGDFRITNPTTAEANNVQRNAPAEVIEAQPRLVNYKTMKGVL